MSSGKPRTSYFSSSVDSTLVFFLQLIVSTLGIKETCSYFNLSIKFLSLINLFSTPKKYLLFSYFNVLLNLSRLPSIYIVRSPFSSKSKYNLSIYPPFGKKYSTTQ